MSDTLRALVDIPEWKADAHCLDVDPDVFFPHPPARPTGGALRRYEAEVAVAKAHCRRCDVQAECLAYALANSEPYGVWGGMSVEERRSISPTGKTGNGTKCGTRAGYMAHWRAGEPTCEACRDAQARYQTTVRSARAGVA